MISHIIQARNYFTGVQTRHEAMDLIGRAMRPSEGAERPSVGKVWEEGFPRSRVLCLKLNVR